MILLSSFLLSACGGSDEPVAESIIADSPLDDSGLQCDAPAFDHAELLYTEVDRQWLCSVSSSQLTYTDSVFFQRSGTADFGHLGQVYWNRTAALDASSDEITIASPTITTHVLRDITSANTVLQFGLHNGAGEQQYDCVLVGRDIAIPL